MKKYHNKYWPEIPKHFLFAKLHEFVVIPNHIYGIIVIDKCNNNVETPNLGVSTTNLGVLTNIKIKSKIGGKNPKCKNTTTNTV